MNPIFHGCAAQHRDKARAAMAKAATDQRLRMASGPKGGDTPGKTKLSGADKAFLATKLHKLTDRKQSEIAPKKPPKTKKK